MEKLLPSTSYDPEEGTEARKAVERDISSCPDDTVEPKVGPRSHGAPLASPDHMPRSESPTPSNDTLSSSHEADVSDSGSEGSSQALQTSKEEPLPEARISTSNFLTKSIPAGEVTIFIGINPSKEGTVRFDGQVREKAEIQGRYTLSAEVSGDHLDRYLKEMGYENKDEYVFSQLKCFHLHYTSAHEFTDARIDIPIERTKDASQPTHPCVDIDFKTNQHVAMYFPQATDLAICSEDTGQNLTISGPKVTLTMTRFSDLPENPSLKSENKTAGAEDKEPAASSASASQPETTGNKAAPEDDIVELTKEDPETDVEESRKDSSLLSCCGVTSIRERMAKHHPAAGT